MNSEIHTQGWLRMLLLLMLVVVLPFLTLSLLPGADFAISASIFWLGMLVCFFLLWMLLGSSKPQPESPIPESRSLPEEERPVPIKEVMQIEEATERAGISTFRGHLRGPAATVYERLKQAFAPHSIPMVQEDKELSQTIFAGVVVFRVRNGSSHYY